MTDSLVTLFPKIFILSTKNFSVSSILKSISILFEIIFSFKLAFIDSYCSLMVIVSIFSTMSSILFIEYGSFFNFLKNQLVNRFSDHQKII